MRRWAAAWAPRGDGSRQVCLDLKLKSSSTNSKNYVFETIVAPLLDKGDMVAKWLVTCAHKKGWGIHARAYQDVSAHHLRARPVSNHLGLDPLKCEPRRMRFRRSSPEGAPAGLEATSTLANQLDDWFSAPGPKLDLLARVSLS